MSDEVCLYCGRRGDDICDEPPNDICELAVDPGPHPDAPWCCAGCGYPPDECGCEAHPTRNEQEQER